MNTKVVRAIDAYLDNKGLKETTPVDVGPYLEKRGILKDSSSRPGKPLRDLLRKGQIPNAYQNGNRWVIRRSNFKSQLKGSKTEVEEQTPVSTFKKVTLPIDVESGSLNHKLEPIADSIKQYFKETYSESCSIIFEHKPIWLKSYPTIEDVEGLPMLETIFQSISGHELQLKDIIESLPPRKARQNQAYDLWIEAPFQCAIEFDESQHFNQFRYKTLSYYNEIQTGYSVEHYLELNRTSHINPGSSGFTRLKSDDPMFPPLLDGSKQDNRIRQRAFRDVLKDTLPLVNGCYPTIRIPYHVTGKRIKDFTSEDLTSVIEYISNYLGSIVK